MDTKEKLLSKAIALAADMFVDVYDKSGQPYILHCLHVMNNMPKDDPELLMIAVLHDVVEDTNITFADLVDIGMTPRVINALQLLTHDRSQSYDDYIKAIATNRDATLVKIEDLRHNSDITRLKGLREKDFARMEKYHRSYAFLMNHITG